LILAGSRRYPLAAALAGAGVGAGDKVACYLYNGAAYLETVFAAFKIGAVPVNANYRYTGDELSALLRDADAAALVFSGELAPNVAHAARNLPGLRLTVSAGAELETLLAAVPPLPATPRPGSDELFMYTGGTTGMPKGVIWRQSDLMRSMGGRLFGSSARRESRRLPAKRSRSRSARERKTARRSCCRSCR
jgi:3-oxocholest-4-en-26-oate---CoA ligase